MLYDPTERRIRSFVTRAGRLSTAQERALNDFGPQYMVEYTKAPLDFEQVFGRKAPVVLEIGFGMGQTTAHIAKLMPEKDFIGVEVHTPGVDTTTPRISSAWKCTRPAWAACSSCAAKRTSPTCA